MLSPGDTLALIIPESLSENGSNLRHYKTLMVRATIYEKCINGIWSRLSGRVGHVCGDVVVQSLRYYTIAERSVGGFNITPLDVPADYLGRIMGAVVFVISNKIFSN